MDCGFFAIVSLVRRRFFRGGQQSRRTAWEPSRPRRSPDSELSRGSQQRDLTNFTDRRDPEMLSRMKKRGLAAREIAASLIWLILQKVRRAPNLGTDENRGTRPCEGYYGRRR